MMKSDLHINLPVISEKTLSDTFRQDITKGLGDNPKRLFSKYFYDDVGDKLFQKIMEMPEYYLTDCELDIFKNKTTSLSRFIPCNNRPFDLIELGAGDAKKSTYLLKYFNTQGMDFRYMPIDISGNILNELEENLKNDIPELKVVPLEGEYFEMLDKVLELSNKQKIVLFLGSNIGNMEREDAEMFCRGLHNKLTTGDIVLIGFDLKKNPHTILNAYNDVKGITAAFNLNLLSRINKELGSDFDVDRFQHYQNYDPLTGECRSFLISLSNQQVCIGEEVISFAENEFIHMEVSRKFSLKDIARMAEISGFTQIAALKDTKGWFVDAVWQVS
ncbi:L-histidine N(alpha)-methyltransferase [Sinomicrobium sp. M5D2P17]